MILAGIFQTVEFYVIMAVVAAAVVALSAMPRRTRQARLLTFEGDLMPGEPEAAPMLHFRVMRDGRVELRRTGLAGVGDEGAVTLEVEVAGFDVVMNERLRPGRGPAVGEAVFTMDFFGQEYYHIRYRSESTGLFAAVTLHARPGIFVDKELLQ
ncbi:MAG: hypothetical protein K2L27_04015 [Muribaculaceae bacterium]|nr:hypothetical protein [Muribaculaceae bacterium]